MKMITVFFPRKKYYNKLLKVFYKSAISCMPNIELKIIKMKKPKNIDHKRDTAFSFLRASRYVLKSNGLFAICDCDLLFLKSIEDIEEKNFDIAITVRQNAKMKYNTGLWFCRSTEKAKLFINKWIKETQLLMEDFCEYEDFCWRYGGIDQASLHLTIKKYKKKLGIKILELPCQEWNATQSEWRYVDDNTRIIHIKSQLRGFCCKHIEMTEKWEFLKPLIRKWKLYL